jgi:capsular polysaccharide biosynthesis protein
MTLAMGFLVALAGAVLVALVAEYFDRSLRSAEQIENELGLPVLFSVPRGTRHEMVQN